MSGTSLDGVDAALTEFSSASACRVIETFSLPFNNELRQELLDLHQSGFNELERTALAGNALAKIFAEAVNII